MVSGLWENPAGCLVGYGGGETCLEQEVAMRAQTREGFRSKRTGMCS